MHYSYRNLQTNLNQIEYILEIKLYRFNSQPIVKDTTVGNELNWKRRKIELWVEKDAHADALIKEVRFLL